jgi:hypothetical protein
MTDTAALPTDTPAQGVDTEVHPVKTLNGWAWFTASHAAASLAIADVQAWEAWNNSTTTGVTGTPGQGGITAPQVAAAAGSIGAVGVWGNLGISAANLVMNTLEDETNSSTEPASLQITITNQSTRTIALYKATPENANISNVVPPLASGESGVLVVTYGLGFSSGSETSKIDLVFRVGGGNDMNGGAVTNSAYVELNLEYILHGSEKPHVSNPGRWILRAKIDSSDQHDYGVGKNTLQMYGGTFIGGAACPYFSFYTSSIETGSGQIDVVFYDCAAGPSSAPPLCFITKPSVDDRKVTGRVNVEAAVVSIVHFSGPTLTVTNVKTQASKTMNYTRMTSNLFEFEWDTKKEQDGLYRLSVAAQNPGNNNISVASEYVFVEVSNHA